MGNSVTKQKSSCVVCFEYRRKGIHCENKHFLCHNCFPPYVTSLIEDAGRMADNNFEIHCCYPGCTARPWNPHEVRLMLTGELLEKYISCLVRQLQILENKEQLLAAGIDKDDIDSLMNSITDSLNLCCPSCHIVIDPNPDGCAAIRCGACGKHFCLLCLEEQQNSSKCHSHVRICSNNPSRNVYASSMIREVAHKKLKIQAVQRLLRSHLGKDWRIHQHTPLLLDGVQEVLKACNICKSEILSIVDEGSIEEAWTQYMEAICNVLQPILPYGVALNRDLKRNRNGNGNVPVVGSGYTNKKHLWVVSIAVACNILLGVLLITSILYLYGYGTVLGMMPVSVNPVDKFEQKEELVVHEPPSHECIEPGDTEATLEANEYLDVASASALFSIGSLLYSFIKIGYVLYLLASLYVFKISREYLLHIATLQRQWVRDMKTVFLWMCVASYVIIGVGLSVCIVLIETGLYLIQE